MVAFVTLAPNGIVGLVRTAETRMTAPLLAVTGLAKQLRRLHRAGRSSRCT